MNKLNGRITTSATMRGALTRGAGGGTYVEANPEGEATGTLEKLMVESGIFEIRNVPDTSSAQNGDVLTKTANGAEWVAPLETGIEYSTEEHIIGKWIDGVTPVYEKTYFNNNLQLINSNAINIGSVPNNMDLLVGVDCVFKPAPGGWAGQAGISSVSSWNISFHIADSIVGYGNGVSSFVGGLAICTIRYTKVGE